MLMMFSQLFRKAPMGFIAIFISSGSLFGIFFPLILIPIIFLGLLSSCLFLPITNRYSLAILLFMSLFSGWILASIEKNKLNELEAYANEIHQEKVDFTGIVHDTKPTSTGWRAKIKLSVFKTDSTQFSEKNTYLFVYGKKIESPNIGSKISGFGQFKQFQGKRNPGDFNFRSFFTRKHILGKVFCDKKIKPIVQSSEGFSYIASLNSIRQGVKDIFSKYTDSDTGGMLTALILGEKSFVDEGLRESFVKTGVIHVLAVSGLHVGYVLLVLSLLTSILRIPWGWDRFFIILGLILFCLLTGMKPSVIRASLMASLFLLSPVMNRTSSNWNIIGTSAILILIFNPLSFLDLGFLLSFFAVISIIYFYGYFETHLPDWINPSKINNSILKFTIGLFFVSIAAQIGTLPITAYTFGQAPLISSIANVFIVPLIGLLVALGFAIIGFSWMPFLPEYLGESAWALQWIIKNIADIFASFPYATLQLSSIGLIEIFIYIFTTTSLILLINVAQRKMAIFTLLISINLIIWPTVLKDKNITDILFLDVGQGDATLIRFPNGTTMLVDAGFRSLREDMGERVVVPVLNHLGIDKIDWLVMSHPHSDHIGGVSAVVEAVRVDTVWDTYIDYKSGTYQYLLKLFNEKNIIREIPIRGNIKPLTENSSAYFYTPDSIYVHSQHNVNNASIVFTLKIGANSVLFTGDLEEEGDHVLSGFKSFLKSDILKVAHHGSITSSTEHFLKEVHPDYAIVSVGEGNKFRHPSSIVMDRFRKLDIKIKRTDYLGAVWFKTNGTEIWEHQWK